VEDLEDADDVFEALIIDVESKLNIGEPDNAATYLTTFGDLTPDEASSTSTELANKAFSHSLIAEPRQSCRCSVWPARLRNSNVNRFARFCWRG